jgi:phosphate transport system substrate-binding protein
MTNILRKSGLAAALVMGLAAQASALSLNGAGSSFIYPLMSKWVYAYQEKTGVQINYASIGSGAGIHQLQEKTVNFGASDAFMTSDQMQACGGTIIHLPATMGAVAISYNLPTVDKDSHLKMTGDVLAKIYLGVITNWNDDAIKALNPDVSLPDQVITVVHRADGSGTTSIFTDYLTKVSTTWAGTVGHGTAVNWPAGVGGKGNEAVAGVVGSVTGAIGYVELAYVLQNHLAYCVMKNREGNYIAPSLDAVSKASAGAMRNMPSDFRVSFTNAPGAESYPICGFTWILVRPQQDAEAGKALVDFLTWAETDGQAMAPSLSYAPLPDSLVEKIKAKIATIKY